jgi:hypothetical protein
MEQPAAAPHRISCWIRPQPVKSATAKLNACLKRIEERLNLLQRQQAASRNP